MNLRFEYHTLFTPQNIKPRRQGSLSRGGRFLITSDFPQEGQAGHLVAATDGLTFRMIQTARPLSTTVLPIAPVPADYTGRAACPEKERPGSLPFAAAYTAPFRHGLIGVRYSYTARDGVGFFTGQHHQPFYPGDPDKHPERAPQVAVCLAARGRYRPLCFSRNESMAPARGRNSRPPEFYLSWPLRRRQLPSDAGCIPHLLGEFW